MVPPLWILWLNIASMKNDAIVEALPLKSTILCFLCSASHSKAYSRVENKLRCNNELNVFQRQEIPHRAKLLTFNHCKQNDSAFPTSYCEPEV